MVVRSSFVAAGAFAVVALSSGAAAACERAHVVDTTALPPAWADALAALDQAIDSPNQLWSCSGGVLRLRVGSDRDGADLWVERRDGTVVQRHVSAPKDLVPMGEALLATLPDAPPPAPNDDVLAPPPAPPPPPPVTPPARASATFAIDGPLDGDRIEPARRVPTRIALGALFGANVTAPTTLLMSGATLRAEIVHGSWSGGVWGRYELQTVSFETQPANGTFSTLAFGFAARRRLLSGPAEISLGFDPALALVFRDGATSPDDLERYKAQLRLGGDLSLRLPVDPHWALLVQLASETSPDPDLDGGEHHHHRDTGTPLPTCSAGLSIGLQTWLL